MGHGQTLPPKERGRQKRSCQNRSSGEHDSKKCIVDTDSEQGHNDINNEQATSSQCNEYPQNTHKIQV